MEAGIGDIRPLRSADDPLFTQVIQLGNSRSDRVGFLPRAAFEAYAEDSTILVMERQGQALGYVCYALPRLHVRLIHLCVQPGFEGRGIARALIAEISIRHHERHGISAKCRPYPGIDEVWRSLGFTDEGQVVGRGRDRTKLTCWWRDHGHPTLFTLEREPEREPVLRVAIDLNVFRDLFIEDARQDAERSRLLRSDHVAGQIDIFVTNELARELDRMTDQDDRARFQEHLRSSELPPLETEPTTVDRNYATLLDRVRRDYPQMPTRPADESDLRHVAEVASSNASVFVTRDEPLIERVGSAAAECFGVLVAAPEHVLVRLDELANAQRYRGQRLHGTAYETIRARSTSEKELLGFLNSTLGERQNDLRSRIRNLQRRTIPIWSIKNPAGAPVACYAIDTQGAVLNVALLRIADTPLAETLCMQLLFQLRKHCRKHGQTVLRITDPNLSVLVRRITELDGFRVIGDAMCCLVVQACGPAETIELAVGAAATKAGINDSLPIRPKLSAERAAELERLFWPAKITDSQLPTWVLPILPKWSSRLFNSPESLETRADKLGISREHVYYNSGRPSLEAPARIIWYRSGQQHGGGQLFACSRLEQVSRGDPDELHGRFSYLGVLGIDDVRGAASRRGEVQALRFADTELFPWEISLSTYHTISGHTTESFPCARRIPGQVFQVLYRRAHKISQTRQAR